MRDNFNHIHFYLGDDDDGNAIYLATPVPLRPKKPGQVAPQPIISGASVRRGARSGNPNFDPRSGTFAKGGGGSKQVEVLSGGDNANSLTQASRLYIRQQIQATGANQVRIDKAGSDATINLFINGAVVSTFTVATVDSNDQTKQEQEQAAGATISAPRIPDGVDEETFLRRLDAVKDMARQVTGITAESARKFLDDHKSANLSQVDLESFMRDAREHQLDDLTDILDQQLHGKIEQVKRSTKFVRVTAPASWTKKVFVGLNDDEVIKLAKRLEGRGWDAQDITKNVIGKINDEERRTKLEQLFGEKKKKSGKKEGGENE